MRKIDSALQDKLETLISSMGYDLVGCEMLPQGRHMVFRIYLDSPQGVTVDGCSKVSQQVSALLDVEDRFQGKYYLEVSSPGIDRPLFTLKHYQQFVGSKVNIRLYAPLNGRRQYKGLLVRVEGEELYLLIEGAAQETALPFSAIEKGHVIGEIE